METAAILAVAQYRKLFGAAINIAADLPADVESKDDFKGVPDRESYPARLEKSLKTIIPIVVATLVEIKTVQNE